MAQNRSKSVALIVLGFILIIPHEGPAQPTTAPPSSLSTRPLNPESAESDLRGSCDLCRKPETQVGSGLRPHRSHREKGLRSHKIAKGAHRSLDQALKSTLPKRPLQPAVSQEQPDPQQGGQLNN